MLNSPASFSDDFTLTLYFEETEQISGQHINDADYKILTDPPLSDDPGATCFFGDETLVAQKVAAAHSMGSLASQTNVEKSGFLFKQGGLFMSSASFLKARPPKYELEATVVPTEGRRS